MSGLAPEEKRLLDDAAQKTILATWGEYDFHDGRILLHMWDIRTTVEGFQFFDKSRNELLDVIRSDQESLVQIRDQMIVSWFK